MWEIICHTSNSMQLLLKQLSFYIYSAFNNYIPPISKKDFSQLKVKHRNKIELYTLRVYFMLIL